MSRRWTAILCASVAFFPRVALAGMPSPHLADWARLRLQTISFFIVVLLLSALVIRLLWNWLQADFPRLPRLTYGKALAMVMLWGLLAMIVLTMIAGARELLTPGAWEKDGLLYKTVEQSAEPAPANETPPTDLTEVRTVQLQDLKRALWGYAFTHEGHFPAVTDERAPSESYWQVPGAPGMRYGYVNDRSISGPPQILAYEPEVFEGKRFVLRTDGTIVAMSTDDIRGQLKEQQP